MRSGRKIYARLQLIAEVPGALHRLSNGDLRSLVLHIRKRQLHATDCGEWILALAMCEITTRFLAKGKGKCS